LFALMPPSEIVNLDGYEQKRLTILPFEKFGAFAGCFGFVVIVLLCCFKLWSIAHDFYVVLIDQPPNAAQLARSAFFSLFVVVFSVSSLYAFLYFQRAVVQSRPRPIKALSIAAIPVLAALAYSIYAIPQLRQLYVLFWSVYTAHWASVLEVLVIVVLLTVTSLGHSKSRRTWRRLTERDKLFVRDDSEEGFQRRGALRSLLGIPRIADLMPHGRFITMAQFVLAYFFFACSVGWILVYCGFSLYRVAVVDTFYDGVATNPYVRDTAVSHMLYSLSAAFLVLFVAPIIGGYILTAAQRNVHWSISQLLEADGRAPILFLRAFKDDQVRLQNVKLTLSGRLGRWLDAIGNLDGLLLQEGTPYGPVVAIGNPSDRFPPYGAARGYFDNKTWRAAVADLAANALVIIICLDRTEGIMWEVGHIARLGYLPKTLFLLHPKDSAEPENRALADDVTKVLKPDAAPAMINLEYESELSSDAQNGTLLGFFFDKNGVMHAGRSTTFSRLAYLIQVRWFLRSKFGFAQAAV
jgi:hypothetical protein